MLLAFIKHKNCEANVTVLGLVMMRVNHERIEVEK